MITLSLDGDTCTVAGRLDQSVVNTLWPTTDALVPATASQLDLSQLHYSDSAGIAYLFELVHRAQNRGQALTLVQPSPQLAKLIALYDLRAFFDEEASRSNKV